MMSNVDENDPQFQSINEELHSIQKKAAYGETDKSFFDNLQNNVKFIETVDGLEMRIKPEEE